MKYNTLKTVKTFHVSWLIAWLSIGVIVGTVSSLYISGYAGLEWLVVSVCLAFISLINKKYLAILMALFAGVFLGLWRGNNQLALQNEYAYFYNKNVVVVGRVAEDPSYNTEGDLRMRLTDVKIQNQSISGVLWVSTSRKRDLKRSDIVKVKGQLSKGFGNIPATLFRARVVSIDRADYSDVGRDTRDWFANDIKKAVREPEASLGNGFLLGQKTALPEKLNNDLRLLGLTHIIVASGYNLTILIRFARKLFEKISRFTAVATSVGLIYGFLQITGNSPSMARASLIAIISLGAWYFGRKIHPFILLPFSAAITILINPSYAWGDIGWLLSFTAFVGVIIFSPLVHAYYWGDSKPGNIRQVFIETMSAQLLTLPIIAFVFGQYSPLAILANVLILPFLPVDMALTTLAGFGAVIFSGISTIIGWPAEILTGYIVVVVDRMAQWPLASAEIVFNITTVIVSYLLIFVVIIYMWRRTGYQFKNYNIIE